MPQSYDPLFKDRWWVYNDSVAVQRALEGTGEYTPYTQQGSGPRPYDLAGFPFSRPGFAYDLLQHLVGWLLGAGR